MIVGVIDEDFEYTHPSFFDSTGSHTRILRVWQQNDTTGTAPAGFAYGSELTTFEQMQAAVTDSHYIGHGSHVAGIAAGCGAASGTGARYRGMAPGADYLLVETNMTSAGIIDGIRYISEVARSMNRPCVINISLGSIMTSHDGLSPDDVMVQNYLQSKDSLAVALIIGNDTVVIAEEEYNSAFGGERLKDLSPYAGQLVRLAFHHHATGGTSIFKLSNLRIDYHNSIVTADDGSVATIATSGDRVTVRYDRFCDEVVSLFDLMGRRVASAKGAADFRVPASGIYMVKIGNRPAQKVVVVK